MLQKNFFLIFCLLIFKNVDSYAQNRLSGGLSCSGLLSFPSVEMPYSNSGINEQPRTGTGFSVGIVVQLKLVDVLWLRSGLGYRQQIAPYQINGLRFASDIQAGTSSSIRHYITGRSVDIPFEACLFLPNSSDKKRYYVGAGIQLMPWQDYTSGGRILYGSLPEEELTKVDNQVPEGSSMLPGIFVGMESVPGPGWLVDFELFGRYSFQKTTLYLYDSSGYLGGQAGLSLRFRME